MTIRVVQLIARYLAMGLVGLTTKLGCEAQPGQFSAESETIASGLVALVLAGVDLYLHHRQKKTPTTSP